MIHQRFKPSMGIDFRPSASSSALCLGTTILKLLPTELILPLHTAFWIDFETYVPDLIPITQPLLHLESRLPFQPYPSHPYLPAEVMLPMLLSCVCEVGGETITLTKLTTLHYVLPLNGSGLLNGPTMRQWPRDLISRIICLGKCLGTLIHFRLRTILWKLCLIPHPWDHPW